MTPRRNRPVTRFPGWLGDEDPPDLENASSGLSAANLEELDAFERTLDLIQLKHHPDSRLPSEEPDFWDDREGPGDEDEP